MKQWLRVHERFCVWGIAILFFVVTGSLVVIKLNVFGYNALDLAIFHQALARTADGNFFHLTIHPHSYLGDHASYLLVLLVPLYWVWHHPATLLLFQTAVLALGVFPVYRLSKRLLPGSWAIVMCAVYALHPLVTSTALFEFHMLSVAMVLLLWAIVYYSEDSFRYFVLFIAFATLVREDVGLVAIGFGILGLVDRKSVKWAVTPILIGVTGFAAGILVTSALNTESYKFLSYYGWLGGSFSELLVNAMRQPHHVLLYLFRAQNIFFAVTLLIMTGGLALARVRLLLPTSILLLALFLTSFGGNSITLRTHYPALIVPFLLWATVEGWRRIQHHPPRWVRLFFSSPNLALGVLLGIVTLYGIVTLSPLQPAAFSLLTQELRDPRTDVERSFVRDVPSDARVATTYALLPMFGNHDELYSMHYAFTGKRQLSDKEYTLPDSVDTVLYDSTDALFYTVQFAHDQEKFTTGDDRLRTLLARGFRVQRSLDGIVLFRTTPDAFAPVDTLYSVHADAVPANAIQRGPLFVALASSPTLSTAQLDTSTNVTTLPFSLTWSTQQVLEETYWLNVTYTNTATTKATQRSYPIAYGLYPTTEWRPGDSVAVQYELVVPQLSAGSYTVTGQIVTGSGYLSLTPLLSAQATLTELTPLGEPFPLASFSLDHAIH